MLSDVNATDPSGNTDYVAGGIWISFHISRSTGVSVATPLLEA